MVSARYRLAARERRRAVLQRHGCAAFFTAVALFTAELPLDFFAACVFAMPSLLSRLLTPEAHDHAEADASPPPSPPPARSLLRALLLGLAEPPRRRCCAIALHRPTTPTLSLNLESNQIASAGVVALAAALRRNASLRELKLASQGQSISQAAEEALAEALACNSTITKLTLDTRSTRARDLIAKGLLANQERLRRERSSSAYTYVAVADSPLGRRG